jgi:hypothetical protein
VKDERAVAHAGRFVGNEVEHSPFYGMRTLFISRFSCIAKPGIREYKHVYLAIASNPGFWDQGHNWKELLHFVRHLIEEHYCVTVDLPQCPEIGMFTDLRRMYPGKFCLMLTVTVPFPDFGAFCLKAEPKDLYSNRHGESGVYVAKFDTMKRTAWPDYVDDEVID